MNHNFYFDFIETEEEDRIIEANNVYEEVVIGSLLEKGEDLSDYSKRFFKEKNSRGEIFEMIERINVRDLRMEYLIIREKNGKILFKETVHSYDPAMKLFYSLLNYGDDQHMCVEGAFRFYYNNPISNFLDV